MRTVMTNDNWDVFKADLWDGISMGDYPRGKPFYLNDHRYWVSRNSLNQLVFYVHDICRTQIPVLKSASCFDVTIEKYNNNEQRLVCTFLDSADESTEKFGVVLKSIAIETERFNSVALFANIQKQLQEWSVFLSDHRTPLSRAEFIGFWGELYVVSNFIMQAHDATDAIRYWTGPSGGKKDITLNNCAIEIKTTSSSVAKFLKISSLDQLDRTTDKLYLMHLFVNYADHDKGVTLRYLYDLVYSKIKHDFAVLAVYKRKADNIFNRASPIQKEEPLACSALDIYDVLDDFPKLLRSDVPSGVIDAKYDLSVSSIQDFCVTQDLQDIIKNG